MAILSKIQHRGSSIHSPAWNIPRILLSPVPLILMQPVFSRIAAHVARSRPELFERLGPHLSKRFLIDPVDLPFVLVLIPDAKRPHLTAYRRQENPFHDACVAGTFFNLLEMIDGSLDGDALFFTRDLRVSGDTEAVVALRNALDDFDGSVLDNIVMSFGPLSKPVALALSALRTIRAKKRHEW
jgi:predicted lipid carrier protein YhbT